MVDISVEFGAENTISISRDSASTQGESADAQGNRIQHNWPPDWGSGCFFVWVFVFVLG
jgi:hypothetical protein